MRVIKAHAYGNDFLFVEEPTPDIDCPSLAVRLCHRHLGVGADGLILYTRKPGGATMRLLNADGSWSELSGNGLRCLAAIVAREETLRAGALVTVETDAGTKTLTLLGHEAERYVFRAAMGQPTDVRRERLQVLGETVECSVLGMGNPQCVVLGPLPDDSRFTRLGQALATHEFFRAGTNVEFAHVEAPDRVRILIWERGVGPTTSSGTGSSAAAVAAVAHGGAMRDIEVVAPGGAQRVEWLPDGVFLTGWADVVLDGRWTGAGPE